MNISTEILRDNVLLPPSFAAERGGDVERGRDALLEETSHRGRRYRCLTKCLPKNRCALHLGACLLNTALFSKKFLKIFIPVVLLASLAYVLFMQIGSLLLNHNPETFQNRYPERTYLVEPTLGMAAVAGTVMIALMIFIAGALLVERCREAHHRSVEALSQSLSNNPYQLL